MNGRTLETAPFKSNVPLQCYFVTIEAEGETEAAEALRRFYGQQIVNNKVLACKTSSLGEAVAQP